MGTTDLDVAWSRIEGQALTVVTTAQKRMTAAAVQYVPDILEDLGQASAASPVATVTPAGLVGVAGDGRPLDSLLYGSIVHTRTELGAGLTPGAALMSGQKWLTLAAGTAMSDTGRQAEKLGMAVRPRVRFYVRMLDPPSCARCVILAGSTYKSQTAFQRHPRCDCRHIPAAEAVDDDLRVNPDGYVRSLSAEEQDRILTKAGGKAYREGADLNQLVNARRGMTRSQSGRLKRNAHGYFTTLEGVTRRSIGGMRRQGRPRLMPESIAEIAGSDRDEFLRLLRANGYVL